MSCAVLVMLADDYGVAEQGPSFEFETFVPAFRSLFDDVVLFPQDRELAARGYFGSATALERLVLDVRPDVVFCVPFENQIDWQVVARLSAKVPTVAWMSDDHWRFDRFSRHVASSFAAVVTTDRQAFARYHDLPGVTPILSQWGVNLDRVRPVERERDIKVSFIGAKRPHRARIVRALQRAGIDVVVRGSGWTEGRATTEELAEVPGRSLITLNFSDSSQRHGSGRTQVKARPFELGASGSCVVSEPDPQLARFYDASCEIAVAAGPREMVRVVRRLLADEGERLARAEATSSRTLRDHTYDVRLRAILSILQVSPSASGREGSLCVTR